MMPMRGIELVEFAPVEANMEVLRAPEDLEHGQLAVLSESATGIAIVVITIAVAALILAQVQSNATVAGNTTANTAINDGLEALGEFTSFLGVIAIVIVAVVLLGFVKYIGQ